MIAKEPTDRQRYDFELANRAYACLSLDERRRVFHEFAKLRYPTIEDRFFEAVYRVIHEIQGASHG